MIPGAGGTQRALRKAKAMDLALTARMMGADEAERAGLVSRVVPADKLMEEALDAATVIASMSLPSVMMAKECVNRAFEGSLNEGLLFERRVFHSLFATEDQKEGMAAFVEAQTGLQTPLRLVTFLRFAGEAASTDAPRRARFFARLPGQDARRRAAKARAQPRPAPREAPPALRLETSGQHLVAGIGPILERRHTRRCRAKGACPYWQALRGGSLAKQHQQGALHA